MPSELDIISLVPQVQGRALCSPISIQLQAGQILGVLGLNGAGKSTFLKTLLHLTAPLQGEVRLNQRRVTHMKRRDIAKKIAWLPQSLPIALPQRIDAYCLASTYAQQATCSAKQNIERLQHILTLWQLSAMQHRLLEHLSAGELKRVSLAAIMMQNSDILLLDEPTNHLDWQYQAKLAHVMQQLSQQGKSCVVASHDVNFLQRNCTQIMLWLPHGQHLVGDTADILNAKNLADLYGATMARCSAGHWTIETKSGKF